MSVTIVICQNQLKKLVYVSLFCITDRISFGRWIDRIVEYTNIIEACNFSHLEIFNKRLANLWLLH